MSVVLDCLAPGSLVTVPDFPWRTSLCLSLSAPAHYLGGPHAQASGTSLADDSRVSLAPVTGSGESREPWEENQKLEFCRNY